MTNGSRSIVADRGRLPIVVLISGRGSNMHAIAELAARGELPVEVRAVISDKADAPGLELAASLGLQTRVLSPRVFADRGTYDASLADLVASFEPALIVLAGWMRILSPAFTDMYGGRILNIHPSLLPKYRGLHTHRRALQAGDCQHGLSVHFVTLELDGGPVIVQVCIDVYPGDTEASLSARVQREEHRIYPQVIEWYARGRLELKQDRVFLDGQPLETPIFIDARDKPSG